MTTTNYIEISLNILRRFTRPLPFDIYIKRGQASYTKIFKKGDQIDWQRVAQYEKKGINYFFVTQEEYAIYGMYVDKLGEHLVKNAKNFKPDEAVNLLKEMVSYTMGEILKKCEVDEQTVSSASNIVSGCVTALGRDQKGILKLIVLLSNQPYIMKHSVTVSIFAVMLAKASGIEADSTLNIIGMGAFLHDIGVGQLSFDPEDLKMLTPDQRKEMWRHPDLGASMIDNLKGIRSEVVQIVLQHHEQPNGHGYPNGLRGPEIYLPAKIVAIADTFAALITKRTYRDAFKVSEALQIFREHPGKYDKRLVEDLASLFSSKLNQRKAS